MKIADPSVLSALALKSLEESIVPELHSSAALSAIGFIRDALRAVEQRTASGTASLLRINGDGSKILEELISALRKHGASIPDAGIPVLGDKLGYEAASEKQTLLSAQLASLVYSFTRDILPAQRSESDNLLLRHAAEWECAGSGIFSSSAKQTNDSSELPLPKAALETYLRSVHPDGEAVRITSLERVNGGFGKQTYMLEVMDKVGAVEKLVVRKEDKIPLCDHRSFNLEREFEIVKAVNELDFPAPKPLWFGREVPGIDAAFYLVERLPGRPAGSFLGGSSKFPERLALEFAALLAKLHQLPLEAFSRVIDRFEDQSIYTETVQQSYRRHLKSWRDYVAKADTLPSPLIAFLLDWLDNNIPSDNGRPVLVHGDYSIHNVLAEHERITGVLDWEAAMFGAPGIDLAYVQLALAQHIDWGKFVSHYRACGGRPIDEGTLNYHLAFQAMKIMVAMVRAHHLMTSRKVDDIRMSAFELRFLPQFMQIALKSTKNSL